MQIHLCTRMLTAALFIVPKAWKQCKHPTKRERLNKLWYSIKSHAYREYLMTPKNVHDMLIYKQEMKVFNLACMYLFIQMEKRLGLNILTILI